MPFVFASAVQEISDSLPWLVLCALLILFALLIVTSMLLARVKALEAHGQALGRLDELKQALDRLQASHAELDLRRLEHVLIDIRDGQRRVEDRLLATVESAYGPRGSGALIDSGRGAGGALADRIVTRMLALGYDRIQLVTSMEDVQKLVEVDGEVLLEARRDGAPCKGKVSVRRGALADVQMQAAYSTFP